MVDSLTRCHEVLRCGSFLLSFAPASSVPIKTCHIVEDQSMLDGLAREAGRYSDLSCKHEALGSSTRIHVKQILCVAVPVIPVQGHRDRRIPEAHWLASIT